MSHVLTCETDFVVGGVVRGEAFITVTRIACTVITLTVTSAWTWKKISRLRLFFAHWLGGLVLELGLLVENVMITVCWTRSNLVGLIKTIKYIELAASNMLAMTNLAICVNLSFIVLSHRSLSRVNCVTSYPVIGLCVLFSMGVAAVTVPFWDTVVVFPSAFWLTSSDQAESNFVVASNWYVEFFVGICMFVTVTWLLMFRVEEIRQCWQLHVRIRYYFGLTILATVVNLGLGICGTLYLVESRNSLLLIWSWFFRYIHIALDTLVLYGVLRKRGIDERADGNRSSSLPSRVVVPGGSAITLGAHSRRQRGQRLV